MIVVIPDLLGPSERGALLDAVARESFADGGLTAGRHARAVKRNLQLDLGEPRHRPLHAGLAETIYRHPLFGRAARPRRFARLMVSRYETGMEYGSHYDDPIIGAARTDVSFTVFLGDPGGYEGGELILEAAEGERRYKLPAGAAILYPAGVLHRVAPVARGTRLAVVGWAQSLVRDPARRQILFDLDGAAEALFAASGRSPAFDAVAKSSASLMRLWAEL